MVIPHGTLGATSYTHHGFPLVDCTGSFGNSCLQLRVKRKISLFFYPQIRAQ
jgi:hypothetical protein